MKILHVCSSSAWGGLEKYSIWLAGELKARGHEVGYLCREGTTIHKEAQLKGVKCHSIKGYLTYVDIRYAMKIRSLVASEGYEIIHAHMSKDLGVVVPSIWRSEKPKLFFSLHMVVPAPKKDLYHRIQYSRVKKIFALGAEGERSAVANLPVRPDQAMELPYGLEVDKYIPGKSYKLRRELGIADDAKTLGIFSRIDPVKGQMEAVRAMPHVLAKHPESVLVIAGDETEHLKGKVLPVIQKEIAKLGLREKVVFAGFRSDVVETLNAFDVFLLPSHYESYSISVIEAKLCAIPIVAASSGGIPQNLGGGRFGILVEPKSEKALADGIIKVLDDPDGAAARCKLARENALERYDKDRILDIVEKEYAS